VTRRLAWAGAVAFEVVQAVWALRRPLEDLQVYQGAVRAMWHGGSLYSFVAGNGDPFTYPPFAGLVLAPVALPGVPVVWTLLTFGAVLWCAVLVGRWWPPVVLLVLLASAPVARDLRFGQLSIFLVLLVLLDGLGRVPDRARGIATGVAAAIKLTPLVFIPYFWLAGQRRAALTAGATFAGCTVAAWLLLPEDSVRYWFTELWHTDRIGNLALTGNQSLNGMLLRSGVASAWVKPLWAVLAAVVVGVGLVRASRAARNGYPLVGLAIAGAVGVVVSPVSWTHHQIWLVFAAAGTVGTRPAVRWGWVVTVLAIMIVPIGVENLRGPLALAVATLVPFAEVARGPMITAHADRTDDHPRPGRAGGAGSRLV
jgi:alpha-1,2-mannosyltransferase